ncbi:MAG: glycosyltransferase family 4 protein [Gemmatimonadota bacterium]
MRLLILNWLDRDNPQAGGAEIHLHEIFGRLAADGAEITVISCGWEGAATRAELDGMQIVRVGSRNTYPLHVAGAVRSLGGSGQFDLVVEDLNKVALLSPTWSAAPVLLLVHHLFGRTVFEEAPFHLALPTYLMELPIPYVYRTVPIVAVSESTRSDLVQRGLPGEHIEVIPNGVEIDAFSPAPEGHRFEEPTILYLGRLKRYKRVDLVIRALALLRSRGSRARLIIAGKGDHGRALESEARKLGLDGSAVRFLGFVSSEQKRELLSRAWVHCLTSAKEGWGIANLEAAAAGTPTVASDTPGLRDSVVDGVTGYLVPHGNTEVLADRIGRILADQSLRDRLGSGGRHFAKSYSWAESARRMESAIGRAVASDRRRG